MASSYGGRRTPHSVTIAVRKIGWRDVLERTARADGGRYSRRRGVPRVHEGKRLEFGSRVVGVTGPQIDRRCRRDREAGTPCRRARVASPYVPMTEVTTPSEVIQVRADDDGIH